MDLFNENEIKYILHQIGISSCTKLKWGIQNYSNKIIGFLGEHLKLHITLEENGVVIENVFFVKCMPRFDEEKAKFLRGCSFFSKEYTVLTKLFKDFKEGDGLRKFRPKLLFAKEELFVFEDVKNIGYSMPNTLDYLKYDEVLATVAAVAKFHAQSYILEECISRKLKRQYSIWEDYSQYLSDPANNMPWRRAGMKVVIEFLKIFSQFKSNINVMNQIINTLPNVFDEASRLMKPNPKYRNVVVHKDIWTNNVLFKKLDNGILHALLVDFQTVLYTTPMLDLSLLMYLNTSKNFRSTHKEKIIDYYYDVLKEELQYEAINIESIVSKQCVMESYNESVVFGMTEAAVILPIALLDEERQQKYNDPDYNATVNFEARSLLCIDLAKEDDKYRQRVTELFDEIAETAINF